MTTIINQRSSARKSIAVTAAISVLMFCCTGISVAQAEGKTQMRLYKMSNYGQSQRIRFTSKKSKLEGCHNLKIKSTRVHRAVHFGFDSCSLYSEKDCATDSLIGARLGDKDPEETVLSQGHSWFLGAELKDDKFYKYSKQERGESVPSWSCEGYKQPLEELDRK